MSVWTVSLKQTIGERVIERGHSMLDLNSLEYMCKLIGCKLGAVTSNNLFRQLIALRISDEALL